MSPNCARFIACTRFKVSIRCQKCNVLYVVLLHVADLQYGVTTQHCLTTTNLGLIHTRLITVYFNLRCLWLRGGGRGGGL